MNATPIDGGSRPTRRQGAYQIPKDSVTYNYRYFLPFAPQWGPPEFCQKRLVELLDFCRQAGIDAVQFYVNTLPGTYYMPAHSADEQAHWAKWMRESVSPALAEIGVSYQLNLQTLLGSTPYGLDMRDEYDWEFLVNQNGRETLGCACPIGPRFRLRMGEMLRLWASTEPEIVWIDDDFRLHNHGLASQEMDYYCYCEHHLSEFAKTAGRDYERRQLLAEVLRPGPPSPVRGQWLDFLGRTMDEMADWVRQQIQDICPRTRLAQMTSAPDVHSAEGRDWKSFLGALCGPYTPITRPCCGVYSGTMVPIKHNAITYRFLAQSIAALHEALGTEGIDLAPELENSRFTTWCKSSSNTRFVLILSQLLGCPQAALSLNDEEGSPIADEPTLVGLLRGARPVLETLAKMELRHWRTEGVVFINDPLAARKVQVGADAHLSDIGTPVKSWEETLLQVGIPAQYLGPAAAADSDDVVVLESYTTWCLSDEQLRKVLAGAVLLDGGAAEVIQRRGFGEHLGVAVGDRQTYSIMAETYRGGVLPGLEQRRTPHRGSDWYELTLCGAQMASEFVDGKDRRYVGSAVYENKLGGRVAVYASVGDLSPENTFGSHSRLRWLHGTLRWISRETFGVLATIPHHGLTVVRSKQGRMIVAFANLGSDKLEQVDLRLRLSNPCDTIETLDESGRWQEHRLVMAPTDAPDVFTASIRCQLQVFDWLVAIIRQRDACPGAAGG